MNRPLLDRLVFLTLVLLLTATAAHAQGANTIDGRVILPNGSPPAQPVRVSLTQSRRPLYETFTDLSGRFYFSGLAPGTYQLIAEGDGLSFETTSVMTNVGSFGRGGQMVTQDIHLRVKPGSADMPAGAVTAEEIDPDVPDAAKEKYRQGLKSAAASKPEQAIKLFQEAVEAHARFYAANLALAEQLSRLQRYDEALAAYRRAGELKPDRAEPYVGIGVTLVSQKRYDEGIRLLRGVVEVDKDLPAPYLSLGYAEMMTRDYHSAEEHLLRAVELARPPLAHIYLANVYEQTGEFSKAVAQLEAYLKENPRSPQADAVRAAIEKLRQKEKSRKP